MTFVRNFALLAGALLLLATGLHRHQAVAQTAVPQPEEAAKAWWNEYFAGARLVRLPDGHALNLYCRGKGSPIVVLEGGLGDAAWAWRGLQAAIARDTKVCVYDRAGYWNSPAVAGARDASTEADDLANLLRAAHLPAPYLLVGHSYGAYIIRLFASRHPDRLAGLVLVDPSSPYQTLRLTQALPRFADPIAQFQAAENAKYKACAQPSAPASSCILQPAFPDIPPERLAWFQTAQGPGLASTMLRETEAMKGISAAQVESERIRLGAIPFVLLTRGNRFSELPGASEEETVVASALWRRMHREILDLSTNSEMRVVEGAGHSIQTDKPQAVIAAIADVLAKARAGAPQSR
ncbi:MAG TPA: alpha/beta hydrolase [Rhizomicrobium sp.]|nr:alpha/beta hydrolase [Rhizomicrobium sp.]